LSILAPMTEASGCADTTMPLEVDKDLPVKMVLSTIILHAVHNRSNEVATSNIPRKLLFI